MVRHQLIILLGLFICNLALVQNCKRAPAFLKELGFDPNRSALTTTIQRQKGVVLVEYDRQGNISRQYQHPSWKTMGHAVKVTLGSMGDAYVLPTPMVKAYNNPAEEMNTIYRKDNQTGRLEKWLSLPVEHHPHPGNPYGLMGAVIDCNSQNLYVSTISALIDRQIDCNLAKRKIKEMEGSCILAELDPAKFGSWILISQMLDLLWLLILQVQARGEMIGPERWFILIIG